MDKKLTPEQAQAKRDQYNAYYEKNKEQKRATSRARYKKNKEKIKADYRARYKKYKEAAGGHPWHETQKQWRTKNKAHKNSLNSAYRARKAEAMLPTTDLKKIKSIYEKCTKGSEKTETEHQVDHIIPLSLGGAHHQDNLRIIPATENQEKKDKIDPSLGGVWADNDLARKQKEE